ncbi:hypothetical protein AB434_2570 [Heyndrickxia coagulans]|uniref:Uncharacterized protein n=1 Tax=Heyndrickxia coagulans TaxID=1398 RepID=A0A133KC66_HEYCO|nr:hypothetical protein AB434_2570 [Heyndrickxia coagulans]KWZ77178.1 hypothetical protein HMPREF3213_03367 [Heyndrickxia coagulans]
MQPDVLDLKCAGRSFRAATLFWARRICGDAHAGNASMQTRRLYSPIL